MNAQMIPSIKQARDEVRAARIWLVLGATAIELRNSPTANLLPLPARHERGEGNLQQKHSSSPWPSPPSEGREREVSALSALSFLNSTSLLLVALLLLGAGCATGPGSRSGIDSLHLFSVPVALDLDGAPGPDGFGATIYASAAATAKGLLIANGKMEMLMFDGTMAAEAGTNAAPKRVWTFTSAELKDHLVQTALGVGYRFTLSWSDTPPLQNRITIVARYVPSRGRPVQSSPATIAVTSK